MSRSKLSLVVVALCFLMLAFAALIISHDDRPVVAEEGTRVEAPGTRVESDKDQTRIQAPGVDITVPKKDAD